jgi:hypothetical protein
MEIKSQRDEILVERRNTFSPKPHRGEIYKMNDEKYRIDK